MTTLSAIRVQVNGEDRQVPAGSLLDMLTHLELDPRMVVVEQNRDGQMAAIIKDENPELGAKIVSILVYNGLPITPKSVVDQIFDAAQSAELKTAQM